MITVPQFLAVCPSLERSAGDWVAALNDAMEACEANTPARAAMFLAQAAHESAGFRQLTENMNYTAAQLQRTWPTRFFLAGANNRLSAHLDAADYAHEPERIANTVYSNRGGNGPPESGDGWRYRARGCGITFRDNYAAVSKALFKDKNVLLEDPELLATGQVVPAFSFAWYWKLHDLNRFADTGDLDGCSDMINGGRITATIGDAIGYQDRKNYFDKFSAVLGI